MKRRRICIIIGILLCLVEFGAEVNAFEANPGDLMQILHLKVLTLNIHSGVNWSGKYDLDTIVKFISEADPDLVGLQEVDRFWSSTSQFQDLPGELALRLKMFSSYSVSLARDNGYFGNLILSKYPITLMWAEQLPGSLERRSFMFTQVTINGIRINFGTAHLGLSDSDRLQQAATMLRLTSQIDGPVIITGDFNADASDDGVKVIKENFIDVQELCGLKQGTFRLKNGKIGPLIDYILITPEFGLVNFRIFDNYISDHLPVMAELSLMVN